MRKSGSTPAFENVGVSRRVPGTPARTWGVAAWCGLVVAAAGCGSTTAPENAPAGHTEVHGGAAHMPGLKSPTEQCASCHGSTLQGGANGEPSCYSCHGKKW